MPIALYGHGANASTYRKALLLSLMIVVLCMPCMASPTLSVGSKRFTESHVLGEILTELAKKQGVTAVHHAELGNTGIVFQALKSGEIDVYPEYTGTISQELLKDTRPVTTVQMNAQLAPLGLAVGVPLGFNDTYALAMRKDQAQKLGIKTMSDLAKHQDLKFGLSPEFIGRADGWPGVKSTYGLSQAQPSGVDHGLAYEAISQGQIDVMDIYSTDSKISKYNLLVLDDDKHFFPAYDAVLLYRSDLPKRLPAVWSSFQKLQGTIDADAMVKMNADAELNHVGYADIATNFINTTLLKETPTGPLKAQQTSFIQQLFGGDFIALTLQHLGLTFGSLAISIVLGIPLGIWCSRSPAAAQGVLGVVGLIQTIPSLALLAFLVAMVNQIGFVPAVIALSLYALLPIVQNTYTGLTDIPAALQESGEALGLPPGARLWKIELPLARRSILAGIKTSAVINVGTATIAALIGAGGYGERIVQGYTIDDHAVMLSGAIPAAGLALLVQLAFDGLEVLIVPKPLRQKQR
jgi:osmoprotectant transport system permease protein